MWGCVSHIYESSKSGAIRLNDNLDENAIQALVTCGLKDRFPEQYHTWVQRKDESRRNLDAEIKKGEAAVNEQLADQPVQLEKSLCEAIVKAVLAVFPCVVSVVHHR